MKAKALIALKRDIEAKGYLKKALSIKHSISLLKDLKHLESKEKLNYEENDSNLIHLNDNEENKNNKKLERTGIRYFFNKIFSLFKIIMLYLYNFGNKNKFILILIFVVVSIIKNINKKYFN